MSTKKLTQLEREYFVRKLGGSSTQRPLNGVKREYFISQVGADSPSESLNSLEQKWLRKFINDNGGTPPENENELWVEAVSLLSETPTKYPHQNKRIFFSTAP